jgi:SagB-type dehydrogenase family enzyme
LVPSHSPVPLPEDRDSQELTRLSHRLTSWRLVDGPGRTVLPPGGSTGPHAIALDVAPPAAAHPDLFEVIRQRRSYRRFTLRPVAQAQFSGVLHDAVVLARPVHGFGLLRLYVLVRAVAGLDPGVYRYLPENHLLCLIGAGDRARDIESAGLSQQLLGRAAFVMVWAMAADRVAQLDSARGYRHALLDAGVAGEHVYLSAVARGLGVCGVGAFYDDAVNALIRSEQPSDAALYLLGVGHRNQ